MSPTTRLCFRAFIIIIRILRVLMLDPKNPDARRGVDVDAQEMIALLLKEVNKK